MSYSNNTSVSVTAIVALTLVTVVLNAQKSPMKFGKPSKAELEMKVCPFDTSAKAMVLYDFGYFHADNFEFVHTFRIKIFKKEGYKHADFKNYFYSNAPEIKGITFNIEEGNTVEGKLKSSSIFSKPSGHDEVLVSFAMPNIKVGSVIDIEISYKGFPRDWYFQRDIPVAWSELYLENNTYVQFSKIFYGYVPCSINETNRWVFKKVPAFVSEPYLDNIDNYITRFQFEVSEINIPERYRSYTTSWEALNNSLLTKTSNFGSGISNGHFLNSFAKSIDESAKTELEKIQKAHSLIKQIKWDHYFSIGTSDNLNTIFSKKIGNSGDINWMLLLLLRKLGFETEPVVLCTRSKGRLSKLHPNHDKLNYVLAYVKLSDGTGLCLDATERFLPYNLLPERCYNGFGEVVLKDKSKFVDLIPTKGKQESVYYTLSLSDDLSFEGTMNFGRGDYAAYNFRDQFHSHNDEEKFIEAFRQKRPGLTIKKYALTNIDSIYSPLKDEYQIKIEGACDNVNGEILFKPMFYEILKENPYKSEERKYPVDFGISDKLTFTASITIPNNYSIVQKPNDIALKMPDNSASFLYQTTQQENRIIINSKFIVNKQTFLMDEYPYLKEFYDRVVKKTNEPIILRMK